jgi:CTP:molybdopterin cytidylyltransferase MocA
MMVGVLLAAGASKRMGAPKPLVKDHGESFAAHGIRHLWGSCNAVVVVLGSNAAATRRAIESEFERLVRSGALHRDLSDADRHGAAGLEVRFVVNAAWNRGMYGSVRAGLKAGLGYHPEGILVLPVDHPRVRPSTVHDLVTVMRLALEACRSDEDRSRFRYALVPRYRHRRGHPVALSAALARAISGDAGAENLSDAMRRHARLVGFLDVGDRGVLVNRNTPGARRAR